MDQENKITEQKTKKDSSKIGAVIILVISALVFLPFGASAVFQSIFNKQKVSSYGSYNGKNITYEPGTKFFITVSNLAQSYQAGGYKVDENSYYRIMREAFYQTVINMAFTDSVKKSGYIVPKEAVNRAVIERFTDPSTGKFSQKAYNQTSAVDLEKLRKDIEESLVYRRYFYDLFGTDNEVSFNGTALYGLKRSGAEKKFLASMGAEKHSFDAVAFSTANFPKEEAVKFGKENAEKFIKYDLSVITVDDEQEAKALLKQINGNEITFADAASEKSQKYYSDAEGKNAGAYRYQIENMLDNVDSLAELEKLQKDEISAIIKTKRGYSIFKCDGSVVAADFEDSTVQDAVLGYINSNEKSYIENYFLEIADNFVSEAAISSFDSACKKFNVEKSEVQPFPVNYGSSSIYSSVSETGPLARIASNEDAYKTAFSLKQDEISSPFILGSNVVVLKCTGIQTDEVEDASETEIRNADLNTANSALFANPKVVDYITLMSENKNRK